MFPNEAPAEKPSGVTPEVISRIAFIVTGILIITGGLSALGSVIANLLTQPRQLTVYFWVYVADVVLRLAVGSWLMFGSERLCGLARFGSERLRDLVTKDW